MSIENLLVDVLVRVCRRLVHRVSVVHDELLTLEFLLEPDEQTEYYRRLKQIPEGLFSDLYLVFGSMELDDKLARAVDRLFDCVFAYECLMQLAVQKMSVANRTDAPPIDVQSIVDQTLRDQASGLTVEIKEQADELIQRATAFVLNLGNDGGRSMDEPLN